MKRALTWVAGTSTPRKVYITRVWNFGTWDEWHSLWREYPETAIKEAVEKPLRGQWTRRGKALAETFYNCTLSDEALISYDV